MGAIDLIDPEVLAAIHLQDILEGVRTLPEEVGIRGSAVPEASISHRASPLGGCPGR